MSKIEAQFTEALESRLLLASFASVNSNGTLSVVGTGSNDTIVVRNDAQFLFYDVIVNGQTVLFERDVVKRIWANGFGGNDKITNQTALPSTLIGGSGNDSIQAGTADDSIEGDGGDDSVAGGDGKNTIDGGSGANWADYSSPFETAGTYEVFNSGQNLNNVVHKPHGTDTWLPTSLFRMRATPGDDDIVFFPNTDGIVDGGDGDDAISAGHQLSGIGEDVHVSVYGGNGNDSFFVQEDISPGPVFGGNGNDTLTTETSQNFADAGAGTDTVIFEGGGGPVYSPFVAGPGVEKIQGPGFANTKVVGNDLNNVITSPGDLFGVTLAGGGGNDLIKMEGSGAPGGFVPNVFQGGPGNDTLVGTSATDDFSGGGGTDTVDYTARSDNLNLSLDNHANDGASGEGDNIRADVENILGGSGNDLIIGNPFANSLKGNAGNDTLWGGDGNDTLSGGSGHDQLFGQGGNDTLFAKDGEKDLLDGGSGSDKAQRDNSAGVKDQVLNIETFI
jgi:Ca2+-binding RTX toxin-like protein